MCEDEEETDDMSKIYIMHSRKPREFIRGRMSLIFKCF